MRGGLHGFRIFVACIALGVMAIAGVGSFSRSLTDGIEREGRVILGGDLSFLLIHREADAAERRFLESRGQVSAGATMRAMARTADGRRALVELKAVDGAYPLYGTVALDPDMPLDRALAQRDGAFGAAVDSTLLARLDLKPGARLTIGDRHHRDHAPPSRASPTSSPAASASVRASSSARRRCAPPACWCPAAWCAGTTACGLPTAATARRRP